MTEEEKKFVELCKNNVKHINRGNLQRQIKSLEKRVEKAQQGYKNLVASLNQAKSSLLGHNAGSVKDLEIIKQHPDVESVVIEEDCLIVNTRIIRINKTIVGKFSIRLSRGPIRITNLSQYRRLPPWDEIPVDHPHVYNSKPCFGNIKNVIAAERSKNNWAIVVSLCIEFLKTYSDTWDNGPYMHLTNWKRKQNKREAKVFQGNNASTKSKNR